MKKSKIIIPALAMLVMSTAATVTGTVAWFTMNATAKATGMVVSAKTSGSLIIKEADLTAPALPTPADKGTKITFADTSVHAFFPSTHDTDTSNDTRLKYVSNGNLVNFETGTRMNNLEGTVLSYEAVSSDDINYYKDYCVYLAGDGMAMPDKTITITIDNPANTSLMGALSIDFYFQDITSTSSALPAVDNTNYKGTLNLAKKYNNTAYSSAAKVNLEVSGVNIPKTSEDSPAAVGVRMRVYYDGALIETGVANNDYAVYTACASDETAAANLLYYSDINGSSIVPKTAGQSVNGLYKVNFDASTKLYARSISIGNVAQQDLGVTFSAA